MPLRRDLVQIHPSDVALMQKVEEIAVRTAQRFGLCLTRVEHKRRPHPGGASGLCYCQRGVVAVVLRYREGKVWWKRRLSDWAIFRTLAHELAHLKDSSHSEVFASWDLRIWEWIQNESGLNLHRERFGY
jgi:hypothetical protein